MSAEAGADVQSVDRKRADDRVEIGRYVITAGVAIRQSGIGKARKKTIDLFDRQLDIRVVGSILIRIGIGVLRRAVVAVTDEELSRTFGANVLQVDDVRENRRV